MITENKRVEEVRAKLKKADELRKELLGISRFLTIKDVENVQIVLLSKCFNKDLIIEKGELFDKVIHPIINTMEEYLAKKEKEWESLEI